MLLGAMPMGWPLSHLSLEFQPPLWPFRILGKCWALPLLVVASGSDKSTVTIRTVRKIAGVGCEAEPNGS